MAKTKAYFDAWLTFGHGDEDLHWYFHILPRMTLFLSPMTETMKDYEGNDVLCITGKEYDLQIGWLCFEVSISIEQTFTNK